MERDITERLEDRANSYEQSGPSAHHTAALLREAKFEIENARAEVRKWHSAYVEARELGALALTNGES